MNILISIHGGIWETKKKCIISKGFLKKYFIRIYSRYLNNNASFIGYNSKFSDIPCFPHGISGIFISGGAIVGKNCVIFQQVTIGSNTLADSKFNGSPTIGDNCYIGAGAKIVGNIIVGNNVRIGANCVVVTDIPDNSVVVLEKPRVLIKTEMNNKFYQINEKGKKQYYLDGKWHTETVM